MNAIVSCFGTSVFVQNKFFYDFLMLAFFGDKENPSLYDAVVSCALHILESLGWNSNNGESCVTASETLHTLSNHHLMSALNNCAALMAWMCESMDGAVFVASDVRSVNLLTRICLTGCCMVDPQRAQFMGIVVPSLRFLGFISVDTRQNAVHAAVGAMVALSRLISSELLLSKSITDDALLLTSWRLAQSTLTLQHPANMSLAGPDKLYRNFLDVMYVTKFSQISAKSATATTFCIDDDDTQISSSVQATPAALRQIALAAYFEIILSIKDVRRESLKLAENRAFARDLGESCTSELRGLLCGLGWGVVSSLRIKGNVISRLREIFTPHLVAAGYHHTALVPLHNVERFLLNPQHSIVEEFVNILLHWRSIGLMIDSTTQFEQDHEHALSLQCVLSILSPVLAGDNDCNFKNLSNATNLASAIQKLSRHFHCIALYRTRHRLISAANKIKYSAKRAVFNRYVASKLQTIVRSSQPESIWPSNSTTCISWGTTAADIADSAVSDWKMCRRQIKRMTTTTDRLYQGRTRLSMHVNDEGSGRSMVYTYPGKAPGKAAARGLAARGLAARGLAARGLAARDAAESWNISSSDSEDSSCASDSDDSCDSLAGIEKEETLDGTSFSSSRMHIVSGFPINAFTSHASSKICENHGSATASDNVGPPYSAEALDLSHAHYIEQQLQAGLRWGSQNLFLKSRWLKRQVFSVQRTVAIFFFALPTLYEF